MNSNAANILPVNNTAQAPLHTPTMQLVRRLAGGYLRPYTHRLIVSLIAMGVSAAMTGALAMLMKPIINDVFLARDAVKLIEVAVAIMLTFTFRGLSTYVQSVQVSLVSQSIVADIQRQLYGHLLQADLAFYNATSAGKLISRLTGDITVMRSAAAECLTSMGKSTLTLIVLVVVMFHEDWVLAAISFVAFPLASSISTGLGKKLRKVSVRTQEELGSFSSLLNQTFQGARHVKAYGMEAYEATRAGYTINRMFELSQKAYRVSALLTPISEILSGIAIVTVILYGGFQVIHGARTPGGLFTFITAFMLAYEPMKRMGRVNAQLQAGLAAADRVFDLLDTKPAITNAPDAVALNVRDFTIRFDNVHFAYAGVEDEALCGLSLQIPAGATVALVGPSGAGKSTVLNLIPRFYDVTSGAVTIGGTDIRSVTMESLRANIALVSQEVAMFDDTIRANIAYGRMSADDADIEAAAKSAAAHDFITALPQGYDTMVGEHGVKLSGGQRQRIAIARAMLRDAPILLLDEATSALDTASERAVQAALETLSKGRTTLVIAHRLSTIVDADCIYVIDEGRVAEVGTHGELLAKGGIYAGLYRIQGGDGVNAACDAAHF